MKCLFALLQLFLIFQIVLNSSLLSSANKALMNNEQAAQNTGTLTNDQILLSKNQNYYVKMQSDGNFVLYSNGSTNGKGSDNAIWASGSNGKGKGPYRLEVQSSGYLVLYDSNNVSLWVNYTSSGIGVAPFLLVVQNNGDLQTLDSSNPPKVNWSLGTAGRQ